MAKAAEAAKRAFAVDKRDERALTILGVALVISKQHDEGIRRLQSAIELNPNYSLAIGMLGVALVYTHARDRSFELLHKAIRLSPRDPMVDWYTVHLGMNEFVSERYEEALVWCTKAIEGNPNGPPSLYRALAGVQGRLGNLAEARAAYEEFARRAPAMTIESSLRAIPFAFSADAERFGEGLRRAGMPE